MEQTKLSKRTWFNIVLFGIAGQLAWNVENLYFNTFLFNKVGGTAEDINVMVAASAITAMLTTFIMGALSDRVGKRKVFISVGYIVWGVTVMSFAFISRENTAALLNLSDQARIAAVTISLVIIMDCVMTFMGSTCNDAAFNAWITDVTDTSNRGFVEGVTALLPVFATVAIVVGFGAGVTALGYPPCFIALGVVVIICGVIGLFTLKDPAGLQKQKRNYFASLIYGFRPSVIKNNAMLYIILAALGFSSTAIQVIMPYLFIYIQHFLGFDFAHLNLTPPMIIAAVAIIAVVVAGAILFGKLIDKKGKDKFMIPGAILYALGLFLAFFMKSIIGFLAAAAVFFVGWAFLGIMINALVRDYTPKEEVGLFQGVRMIFSVMLPMVIGPRIGTFVINRFASAHELGTYINDYGETVNAPVPEIFAAASVIAILVLVPLIIFKIKNKSTSKAS